MVKRTCPLFVGVWGVSPFNVRFFVDWTINPTFFRKGSLYRKRSERPPRTCLKNQIPDKDLPLLQMKEMLQIERNAAANKKSNNANKKATTEVNYRLQIHLCFLCERRRRRRERNKTRNYFFVNFSSYLSLFFSHKKHWCICKNSPW